MHRDWERFLLNSGATIAHGRVDGFGNPTAEAGAAASGNIVTDLSQFTLIGISGSDTSTFLQGQFTCNMDKIEEGTVSHGAWCNPKGRVMANFLILKGSSQLFLLLPLALKQRFIQRLRMYVLRADVTIEDLEAQYILLGIRGGELPPGPVSFQLPDEMDRYIIAATVENGKRLWRELTGVLTPVGSQHWGLYDILQGLPWVVDETSEQLLPQSLNLDLLGGLSFDKGCYLGQEIIARMHFRGRLKQRMYLASLQASHPPQPGAKLYAPGSEQGIGTVVNAAQHPDGDWRILAITDIATAKDKAVHLGNANGPQLHYLPLPYSISSD